MPDEEKRYYVVEWNRTVHMIGYPIYEVYPMPIVREPDRSIVRADLSFQEANQLRKELLNNEEKEKTTKA